MELINYISKDKIAISNQKTIEQILSELTADHHTHIPVVIDKKIIGNIAIEDLESVNDKTKKLAELEYLYEFFFAKKDDTLLEVFSNFAINNTNMLPIIDENKNYFGYLDLNETLDCFSNTEFLNAEGTILLLEKNNSKYSMSEVCQIVEANSNTVLGCFVNEQKEDTTQITLKVKSSNLNELLQSFRRYDYTIINNLTEDSYLDSLKNRSEYFIKYLNI